MTSSTTSASMGIALTPCPDVDVTGLVRTDAGQDGDGTHPLSSGGQAPPSGQQRRFRAAPGTSGRTSPRRPPPGSVIPRVTPTATNRGPGSSPNHRAVSQSFHGDRKGQARMVRSSPVPLIARGGLGYGRSSCPSCASASSTHRRRASAVRSPCRAVSRPTCAVGVDTDSSLSMIATNSLAWACNTLL
jgi:hypothetical protein